MTGKCAQQSKAPLLDASSAVIVGFTTSAILADMAGRSQARHKPHGGNTHRGPVSSGAASSPPLRSAGWATLGVLFVLSQLCIEQLILSRGLGVPDESLALVPAVEHALRPIASLTSKTHAQNTTIIVIRQGSTFELDTGCYYRYRLRQLLEAAAKYGARGVMADFFLRPMEMCGLDDSVTKQLSSVARETCAKIPVIFGRRIDSDSLVPGQSADGMCTTGIADVEHDMRRIPLQFNRDRLAQDSFALSGLRQLRQIEPSGLISLPELNGAAYLRPLQSFDFGTRHEDSEVIQNADQSYPSLSSDLGNKIWVIGASDDQVFQTRSGPKRGYELQAEYVEALVAGTFVRGLPYGWEWATLGLTALLLWLLETRKSMAHGALVLFGAVIGIGAVEVVLILCNWYSDWTSVSCLTVTVWFFSKLKELKCFHRLFHPW
jgi:hypothetical protein